MSELSFFYCSECGLQMVNLSQTKLEDNSFIDIYACPDCENSGYHHWVAGDNFEDDKTISTYTTIEGVKTNGS